MANPTKYVPSYSFAGYQATNPSRPLPGVRVDTEYNNIALSLDGTITALADIRRDDGQLQNGIVTPEALAPGMAYGVLPPVPWATGTEYKPPQAVWQGNKLYQCILAHVSTVFATDLANKCWNLVLDFQPPIDLANAAAAAAQASAAAAAAAATTASNAAGSATASQNAAAASAAQAAASAAAAAGAEAAAARAEAAAVRAEAAAGATIGAATTDTPPATPQPGQLWWQSSGGRLFVWYVDPGGVPGQWVQVVM